MKKYAYLGLLYFLKSLIYLKRALVWMGERTLAGTDHLWNLTKRHLGFRVYKIVFFARRLLGLKTISYNNRFFGLFGKRGSLQLTLFLVCVIVLVPHSKLYTRETAEVAGRQTILYSLVGPGEQNFTIEEVSADQTGRVEQETSLTAGWREGAVSTVVPNTAGTEATQEVNEISSISAGGTAITKPNILPGTSLPSVDGVQSTGRTELVLYAVENGDTIGQIAEKFGIDVNTILWANDLSTRSYIRPGDSLKILPASGLLHEVKSGDTVSKIARTYDVTAEEVIKFNRLQKDGADIVIGEKLMIPGGEKPQPVYNYTVASNQSFRSVSAPPPSVSAPAGSGYVWPTSVRYISQYYGWRHTAVDIAGPVGTPVYAARAGQVTKATCGWNNGYGCHVIIDHGGGVQTLYAHHSALYVSVGQYVSQGQTIAAMGSTGRSTGPHVHFEVRVSGGLQNPLKYIR